MDFKASQSFADPTFLALISSLDYENELATAQCIIVKKQEDEVFSRDKVLQHIQSLADRSTKRDKVLEAEF